MKPRGKKQPVKPQAALIRLEDLCARSEQCSFDLRRKMSQWGISSTDADNIITQLTENRFLDDSRFARAYTRDRYLYSKWGRCKIITALYAKRIDKSTIDDALSEIDMRRYAAIAFKAIASKLRQMPDEMTLFEKRQRLIRFAIGRGYETSLISRILESSRLWQSSQE